MALRNRHKQPTLVSMWMLDVFCCALGCVTLLWLLSSRAATDEKKQAASSLQDLRATQSVLSTVRDDLTATKRTLNAEIESLQAKLVATVSERDETNEKLAVAKTDISTLETKLATASAQSLLLKDQLAKKQKDATDLTAKLIATVQSAEDLRKLIREKETEADLVAIRAKKAEDQLTDADAKIKTVQKAADDAKSNLAAMRKTGDELSAARATAKDLQTKLDNANVNIVDLQGDKKKLADKFDKLRIESDAKFAGIAMTGKRVVFVVDTSGSMKLIDDKTPAPTKWPIVVETVTRVMRSLPELEQFQVVVFSRKASYVFGSGEWQPYLGDVSQKLVGEKLSAIEPVGDTNMYDALDLAFRLKNKGLDTVYLFSDGLPTSGAGLAPDQEKTVTDAQRTDLLSRHVRQTLSSTWNPARGQRVKINSVGFFFESPEVGAFLWALSRENDGSFVGMSRP